MLNHLDQDLRPQVLQSPHHSLQRAGIVSFIVIAFGYCMHYLLTIVFARLLGPSQYGEFSVVISTISLFSCCMLLGGGNSLVKFLPAYITSHNWANAHGLTKFYTKYCSWVGGIFLFGGLALAFILVERNFFTTSSYLTWKYLWLIPFFALLSFFKLFLRAINRYLFSLFSFSVIPSVVAIVLLACFYFTHTRFTIEMAIWVNAAAFAVAILAQIIVLHISLPQEIFSVEPSYQQRIWLLFGAKLFLTNVFLTTEQSIITLVLKINWHDSQTVAIYTAISTIGSFLWLIYVACNSVLMQQISPAAAAKDQARLQYLTNVGNSLMLAVGSVMFLLLIIFGKAILRCYGETYVVGYIPMLIMAAGILISLSIAMSADLLEFAHNPSLVMEATFSIACVIIVLSIFLCRYYGLYGAAITCFVAQAALSTTYAVMVKLKLKIKPLFFI